MVDQKDKDVRKTVDGAAPADGKDKKKMTKEERKKEEEMVGVSSTSTALQFVTHATATVI